MKQSEEMTHLNDWVKILLLVCSPIEKIQLQHMDAILAAPRLSARHISKLF